MERRHRKARCNYPAKTTRRTCANPACVIWTRIVGSLCTLFFYLISSPALAYYYYKIPTVRPQCTSQRHSPRGRIAIAASNGDNKGKDLQSDSSEEQKKPNGDGFSEKDVNDILKRLGRLELYVAHQELEIQKLLKQNEQLTEATLAFGRVIKLLTQAGLDPEMIAEIGGQQEQQVQQTKEKAEEMTDPVTEVLDDTAIFGSAPSSVIDAADAAGASILAAMLGGKQRMLVEVRDAELSSNPETLVQFIELAILPIAAGLEGLNSTRNRVKIVFPKVSQLLEYRRTMALAAPEVVALSTLGFDPVEKRDKLVVIVAPTPDDEEGLTAMSELLTPSDPEVSPIQQPVVILNYHMLPVLGLSEEFETAYHLRLLSVQYMSGETAGSFFRRVEEELEKGPEESNDSVEDQNKAQSNETFPEDGALEAAMKRAHDVGMNQGVTRGMVIRAYPR